MLTSGNADAGWLLGTLNETHFYKYETKQAFRHIRRIARTESVIPEWETLLHEPSLESKIKKSLQLYTKKVKVTKESCKAIYKILENYRQLRVQWHGIKNIAENFGGDELIDPKKITDELANIIAKVREKTEDIKSFVIGEGNSSTQLVRNILKGTALTAIPTGFKAFDNTNRGIFLGSLFVLGGNTGGGKTALALKLASNFADEGAKVCIISLEMSEDEVMVRNLSRYSRVSMSRLIDPEKLTQSERKKVAKAYAERVRHLKARNTSETIHIPQSDMTIEELFYVIKGFGYKVVIVDYISLLKDAGGDDQWRKLGEIARYSKIFAKNNNTIVVLLAQVTTEGILRYSRAVEEHANNAWYFVRDQKSMDSNILHFIQKKARNQRMFPFDLEEDFEFMDVRDLPEEKRKELDEQRQNKKDNFSGDKTKRQYGKKDVPKVKRKTIKDEDSYFDD